jgi:hypothetical protein
MHDETLPISIVPVMMLMTPAGMPIPAPRRPTPAVRRLSGGLDDDGVATQALARLSTRSEAVKVQGTIAATTPTGSRSV